MRGGRTAARVVSSVALAALLGLGAGCGGERGEDGPPPREVPAVIADLDLSEMEPQVAARLRQTRRAVRSEADSALAWGEFGRVAHAHDLWEPAATAYRRAAELDPEEPRWPYYLGDVLVVQGTDPMAAVEAFRQALALAPDYGPAHFRLASALVTADDPQAARPHFERALEFAPDLQPARVGLAQLLLAEGDAENAARLLEQVLEVAPRHGQAISALGQAYMRLGRRDEARAVAERASEAAAFNLFDDPWMSQVVAEGVSAVLIWDRAKAFLDNGDNEQAVLGLRQVVDRLPDNAEAHQQLAVAYGNLGETSSAARHLEQAVALDPENLAARVQLATAWLELQRPLEAIPHLEAVLQQNPEDLDAPWLMGRAEILAGRLELGIATFEGALAAGREPPPWARNDWGNGLAQLGRVEQALAQFEAVLAEQPEEPQALFFSGLLYEGRGELARALELYCRSMRSEPSPPAQARLQAHRYPCL